MVAEVVRGGNASVIPSLPSLCGGEKIISSSRCTVGEIMQRILLTFSIGLLLYTQVNILTGVECLREYQA